MTNDALNEYIASRLTALNEELDVYGDRDTLIENSADGGNHDDTFSTGESYGWINGQIDELYKLQVNLEEM